MSDERLSLVTPFQCMFCEVVNVFAMTEEFGKQFSLANKLVSGNDVVKSRGASGDGGSPARVRK